MRIRKGDKVKVKTGKDKGKIGKVLKVIPKTNKVVVEGINIAKCHIKPKQDFNGGIINKELPLDASNVAHIDPVSNKITKVGYKIIDNKKVLYSKKSGELILRERS